MTSFLADHVTKLGEKLQSIQKITEINNETKLTIRAVEDSKSVVRNQKQIVKETITLFDDMDQCMGDILKSIDDIQNKLQTIDSFRSGTLAAIENILAITEETAAAATSVTENLQIQMDKANALKGSAVELSDNTEHLKDEIGKFRI